MNEEIKKKWVEALRSGKYKQGEGYLRSSDNKFCCLGVLCDIVSPEGWEECSNSGGAYLHGGDGVIEWNQLIEFEVSYLKTTQLSEEMYDITGVLPRGQLDKPVTYKGAEFTSLASLNDAGSTFEEIADVIEEQF